MGTQMQKKNFIGFRDRVLLQLLRFEKEVYENIHGDEVDGVFRDFLIHLTQEGIADAVGTKQSTIYKELQALKLPALEGEEPLIRSIEKVRIPGKERACAIYFLTQYGHDLAAQKRTYLEDKNLEILGFSDPDIKVLTIGELVNRLIKDGFENNPISALLRIASTTTPEGAINWSQLLSPPKTEQEVKLKPEPKLSVKKKPTMPKVENPYFNRIAIKDPEYFYGRKEEVGYIFSLLRNTQSCSIVGPRRIGKSSLINYISEPNVIKANGFNPEEFIFVPIDLEGLGELTQSEFFSMIIEEIRNRIIQDDLRKSMEKILVNENVRFLDLKNIFRELSSLGKKVVFLLDEFELITSNKNLDSNFFSGLRNLANSFEVGYITSSNVPLLELTLSQETLGSPFFNFFTQVDLGLMDDDSALTLITNPAQEFNLSFSKEVIEFIKQTAGPHPFFIQILCFHFFKWHNDHGTIDTSDFPEITKRFLAEAQPHFQYFWNHLSKDEQNVVQRIKSKDKEINAMVNQPHVRNLKRKAMIVTGPEGHQIFSNAFQKFISTILGDTIKGPPSDELLDSAEVKAETTTKLDVIGRDELPKIGVDWGNNYYIDENAPRSSIRVFNELTLRGIPGLIITRTPTKKAEEQWGIKNSRIFWLCSGKGEGYLQPVLEKISHTIFEFVNDNPQSVILLDGLEYIINNNDFDKTLNFMDKMKEIIAINSSILILPMSSAIFSEKEMALLGKNSVEIPEAANLDFSKMDTK